MVNKIHSIAENTIWLLLISGELYTNSAHFLAYAYQNEARYLVECHETEDFVRRHWLVFLVASSVLLFFNVLVIAKKCWDCRCCCRSKRPKKQGGTLNIVDLMAAELTAEDFLSQVGWFYGDAGNTHGPFVDRELFHLLDEGELCTTSRITLANMPLATLLKDPLERSAEENKISIYLRRPAPASTDYLEVHEVSRVSIGASRHEVSRVSIGASRHEVSRVSIGAKNAEYEIGDQVETLVAEPDWKPRPLQIGDVGKIVAPGLRENGQYTILFDGVKGSLLPEDFRLVAKAPQGEDDQRKISENSTESMDSLRRVLASKRPAKVHDETDPEDTTTSSVVQEPLPPPEHPRTKLLPPKSSSDSGSGSRLKDMAMAFGKVTTDRFQAVSQKVFGTDKKKKADASKSPKAKKTKDIIVTPQKKPKKYEFDADDEKILKDMFQAYDMDRTGAICYKHLAHISKKMQKGFTPDQLHAALNEADRDGDGEVNYREFVTYMSKYGINGNGPLHMIRPEHCRPLSFEEMFVKFDEDQMGAICFKNLVEVARRAGKDFTDEEIRYVINEADRNGDEEVNFKEFKLYLEKVGLQGDTPLHIFANYTEADVLARSLPVAPVGGKKKNKVQSKESGKRSGGRHQTQQLPSSYDAPSQKRNRAATDDGRWHGPPSPAPSRPKSKKIMQSMEEQAASDDDFYENEVDSPKKAKSQDSPGRKSWTPGHHLPAAPNRKTKSDPRDRGLPSKKTSRPEKISGGRPRSRQAADEGSDEDSGERSHRTRHSPGASPRHSPEPKVSRDSSSSMPQPQQVGQATASSTMTKGKPGWKGFGKSKQKGGKMDWATYYAGADGDEAQASWYDAQPDQMSQMDFRTFLKGMLMKGKSKGEGKGDSKGEGKGKHS